MTQDRLLSKARSTTISPIMFPIKSRGQKAVKEHLPSDTTNKKAPEADSLLPLDRDNSNKGYVDEDTPLIHSAPPGEDSPQASASPVPIRGLYDDDFNQSTRYFTAKSNYPSGLDFERVVNHFSIEALRERYVVPESGQDIHPSTKQAAYDSLGYGLQESIFAKNKKDAITLTERRRKKPYIWGYTGRTVIGWIFSIMTGLLTGSLAIVLSYMTKTIRGHRSEYINSLWKRQEKGFHVFLAYAGVDLCLALMSSALCLALAPNAVGSGIPEVKAYLNGVRVQRFSCIRLFFVKMVGTILSVSSDLAISPAGPLVQIGAIMGAACTKAPTFISRWMPRGIFSRSFWKFLTIDLSHFSTDEERRILVSIGSAAGFAAAFGAPIGGLLFSMEETSTYFHVSMFVKTLASTAVATFLLSAYHGDLSDFSIISMGKYQTPNDNLFLNRIEELPLYLIVAIVGGAMGGLFCNFWKSLQLMRRKFFPRRASRNRWKLAEVALVSLITSCLMYWIPTMDWPCKSLAEVGQVAVWEHVHQFDCKPGEVNELAAIFFGSREDGISDILTNPNHFSQETYVCSRFRKLPYDHMQLPRLTLLLLPPLDRLWVTGLVFFFCMTLTLGVSLPAGIFMASFMIGTSLGGAAGVLFQSLFNEEISPSIFALLGAAAILAGIQRTTVSICVILVEGTGQVKTLLPVILTVVVAKYVGDLVSGKGLYNLAMEVSNYPFLEVKKVPKLYDVYPVRQIMSSPATTIGPRERVSTIVRLLRETAHNGYPVVDPNTGRFLGLVRRDQLVALVECGIFEKDSQSDAADGEAIQKPVLPGNPSTESERYGHESSKVLKAPSSKPSKAGTVPNTLEEDDDFDHNAWFVATRQARRHFEIQVDGKADDSMRTVEDSMPLPNTMGIQQRFSFSKGGQTSESTQRSYSTVSLNERGNVYISWVDPEIEDSWVPVHDVMNLGTYCVREAAPVSKAYKMFTDLGLRHLVVLGGSSGGEVVGILTRINFFSFCFALDGCSPCKQSKTMAFRGEKRNCSPRRGLVPASTKYVSMGLLCILSCQTAICTNALSFHDKSATTRPFSPATSPVMSNTNPRYVRWSKLPDGSWAMQTAVTTFEQRGASSSLLATAPLSNRIELHAQLHLGDYEYYDYFNSQDFNCDRTVLYELLVDESLLQTSNDNSMNDADDALNIPCGQRTLRQPIQASAVDEQTAQQYGWFCQVNVMEYANHSNWIHADLTRQEFLQLAQANTNNNPDKPLWQVQQSPLVVPPAATEAATALLVGPPILESSATGTVATKRRRLFSNLFLPGNSLAQTLRFLLWLTVPSPELSVLLLDWSSLFVGEQTGTSSRKSRRRGGGPTTTNLSPITIPLIQAMVTGRLDQVRQLVFGQVVVTGNQLGSSSLSATADKNSNSEYNLLIQQRNQKALSVLREMQQLQTYQSLQDATSTKKVDSLRPSVQPSQSKPPVPHNTIAMLYGCSHCPDLHQQLVASGSYRPIKTEWRTAWKVAPPSNNPESAQRLTAVGLIVLLPTYFFIGGLDWISTLGDIVQVHNSVEALGDALLYLIRHVVLYVGLSKILLDWNASTVQEDAERATD